MSSSSPRGGRLLVDEPAPGVTRLTISNPGKRGALDHAILGGFAETLPQLDSRCVIVTGEGATFSAGYDIGDLPDSVFADEAEKLVAHPFAAAIDALEAYPYPTIAALNGHASGRALSLGHGPAPAVEVESWDAPLRALIKSSTLDTTATPLAIELVRQDLKVRFTLEAAEARRDEGPAHGATHLPAPGGE